MKKIKNKLFKILFFKKTRALKIKNELTKNENMQ